MTDEDDIRIPGAAYAAQIRHLAAPMLRMRYRSGVVIDAAGFPQWDLYARALVELPDPEPGLTIDEIRVLDVLTANELMIIAADPLWAFTADDYAPLTPPGWVWAHLPHGRRLALVPAELYGAFRHLGGVALLRLNRRRRGILIDDSTPVPMDYAERLSDDLTNRLESHLGRRLPEAYRVFLSGTNGATPSTPGIHPRHGFVVDQPFFGLSRTDRHQDLGYASQWFGDRLTDDFLAIGYVQGGLLAVRTAGEDVGSVWFYDADDYRDDDRYDAGYICDHLLYRCADDFDAFWHSLSVAPRHLLELVDRDVTGGRASVASAPDLGALLPATKRS